MVGTEIQEVRDCAPVIITGTRRVAVTPWEDLQLIFNPF